MKQSERWRERRVWWMTVRYMSISPCLKTSPKVLGILILGGYHPTELIFVLSDKVTKNSLFSFDRGS